MDLISRDDAISLGLTRYFTGKPCKSGHVAERIVSKNDCAECTNIRKKKWARANAEQANEKSRLWYAANLEKAAVTRAEWRARYPEKVRSNVAAYQKANKEKLAAAARRWIEVNADHAHERRQKWRKKNHAKILKSGSEWRSRNKFKVNAKKSRRIASKQQATPKWANLKSICEIYAECSRITAETGIQHHVDHIVPIRSKIVCGLHCEANLQVLPGLDNQSKSNRHWPDMPTELRI